MKAPKWQQEGYRHIWMPYTQMKTAPMPLPVVGTEGCRIKLEDGRELVDGIASWWSVCHGYNHPHIISAMEKQLKIMPHVMFAGLNHEPALRLATRLSAMVPAGLERVFFSDSGSVGVEVALKMAFQYWKNRGEGRRNRFVSFRGGYHGDTMGAMSLADQDEGMHSTYAGYMPRQFLFDIPTDEYSFAEFEEVLSGITREAAAVIIEPLVQCAGGFKFHSPDVLAEIYRITKKHGLLFIADECATGFGRTGLMFACKEAGISPDIMVVGKALTGGMITLAATLTTAEVFEGFLDEKLEKALMHGPTFTANPLACAAANASLDLFESEPRLSQVEHIETFLSLALPELRKFLVVKDVRVKGAIGVVEYDASLVDMWELRRMFVEAGVWLRPFNGVIYLMPPFVVSDEELARLCAAIHEVLGKLQK